LAAVDAEFAMPFCKTRGCWQSFMLADEQGTARLQALDELRENADLKVL
jgi:hypothetical protein